MKKVAALGGVVLLGLLGFQAPKILHHGHGSSNASAGTAPLATTTLATVPTTLADIPPPHAAPGQLVSFGLFKAKDPFVQQLTDEPTTATKPKRTPKVRPHEKPAVAPTAKTTDTVPEPTTSEPTPAPATPAAPPVTTTPATTAPATPTVAPTSVSLGTNGVCELVAVKSTFPSATQLFQLVSIAPDGQSVKIGVAGGSLQSGDPTVTVTAAKSVTLVNTADGVRYKLELLSSCPASTATPPPTTTTEPTTTLTATTP